MEVTGGDGAGAPLTGDPSRTEHIRAYLRQLLASPGFASSPRRSRLLTYLCERALAGEGGGVTEYALGLDVFAKPSSFDPRAESIVRVEVGRLRRKLEEHYASDGARDPIVIQLSPRSYIPVFIFRGEAAAGSVGPPSAARARAKPLLVRAGVVALLGLLAIAGLGSLRPGIPNPPPLSLAVLPVVVAPSASDLQEFRGPITEELKASLLRTWGLSLLDWRETRAKIPVALILEAAFERKDGALQASLMLRRPKDGRVAWSGTFPFTLDGKGHVGAAVDALAAAFIQPVLEREANYVAYARSMGIPARPAPLAGGAAPEDPCSRTPPYLGALLMPDAQLSTTEEARGAGSFDTRIPYRAGQRQYPAESSPVVAKQGTPVPLRAPALVQFMEDTCVLTSYVGTTAVYPGGCIIPAIPASYVNLNYYCAPKAYPIDIGGLVNDHGRLSQSELLPAGARILDGIPFLLPDGKNRYWRGQIAADGSARPVSLSMAIGRTSVSTAYFLLNTEWGQPGPQSYLTLEFRADRGAYFEKKLIGGVDVRDYHRGVFTNSINGTTTRPGFDDGLGQRMDLVEVALPAEFRRQTLQSITLKDTGRLVFQRAILWAVTVR